MFTFKRVNDFILPRPFAHGPMVFTETTRLESRVFDNRLETEAEDLHE